MLVEVGHNILTFGQYIFFPRGWLQLMSDTHLPLTGANAIQNNRLSIVRQLSEGKCNSSMGTAVGSKISHVSLSQLIYNEIKAEILHGVLLPSTQLNIRALATKYQTSLVPVREALHLLAGERYIEIQTNRGAWVSPLSVDEAMQIYLIREVLEGTAARLAWGKLTPGTTDEIERVMAQLDECLAADDLDGFADLNTELHSLIYVLSNAPLLCQGIDRYWEMSSRYRHVFSYVPERGPLAQEEHRRIIDALKRPDNGEEVEWRVREHIQRSAEALKGHLQGRFPLSLKGE